MAQGQTTEQCMRIRDWKGLMTGEGLKARMLLLLAMSFAVVSMAFVQMGFLSINLPNGCFGYAMGLLAPVAVTSLLLGKGWGAVEGAFAGLAMYVHAMLQPLDVVEKYMVSITNSVLLYTLLGFLLGLSFAIALRNVPKAKPRYGCIAIVSLIASLIASLGFYFFSLVHILLSVVPEVEASGYLSQNTLVLLSSMGSAFIQYTADALILFASSTAAAILYRQQYERKGAVSINYVFRTSLLVVVVIAFAALSAVSFVAVTMETEKEVDEELTDDIGHFVGQIEGLELSLGNDANDPNALREALLKSDMLKGYTIESDGTAVVFVGDEVALSNNPAYKVGDTIAKLYGEAGEDFFRRSAQGGMMAQVLYNVDAYSDANSFKYASSTRELGYMKIGQKGLAYALLAIPSSMVFSGRGVTMTWITISVLVMLVAVYGLATTLLKRIVVTPIKRTNASLARITEGHLSETVEKGETIEFDSLSDGINATVDALEGWIGEAERRMERDLATAKTIQESALPRTFPPFPEIDKFDIYASMNAAKEVGGDFYDFFLIDDHTLGFLIADVSGKGIPGALFMMAAKTELENFMQTGMQLEQAVAGANARLCANNDAGMFVTVWAATLEWTTGELTYVNAGHNFPLLRHGQDGEWEWLTKKCGLFLGTFETAKYRQETLTLEPGDELVLYTDGVNEAFNVDEEEYG
ncbi:MAG: SpoIIE family protein phosphatase, partial [Atopobiaceae bacterium]|nr:SpoIIE family protein phosphatase [Atopobiaceae bacterium]